MPADRTVAIRRSRRISNQEPKNYNEEWSEDDLIPYQKSAKRRKITVDDRQGLSASASSPSAAPYTPSPTSSPRTRALHARRRGVGYVSRPPNAFMLFRSEFWAKEKLKPEPIERDHRDISRIAAHCWNQLDEQDKQRFQKMAEDRKQLHRQQHPDYKYAPVFRKKPGKRKPRKTRTVEEDRCRKLATLVMGNVASSLSQRKEGDYTTLSPLAKVEEPTSPYPFLDIVDIQSDGGFVPTDDIPPLALPQAATQGKKTRRVSDKRQKQREDEPASNSLPILHDMHDWFNPDGSVIDTQDSGPSSVHSSATTTTSSMAHYSPYSPLATPTFHVTHLPRHEVQHHANRSGFDIYIAPGALARPGILHDSALDFADYVKFDD